MEELELQDKPGLFSRIGNKFVRDREQDEEETAPSHKPERPGMNLQKAARYTVTVRRQIVAFEDAMAAAEGLKRGEQQILNLSSTEASVRQKIVDFMCGVNYAQEGTWEEVGENVYLIVPSFAYVEVAPATPRMAAARN